MCVCGGEALEWWERYQGDEEGKRRKGKGWVGSGKRVFGGGERRYEDSEGKTRGEREGSGVEHRGREKGGE